MKTNFKIVFSIGAICIGMMAIYAFKPSPAAGYSYMQVCAIESIVPGGAGRSQMLIQDETGKVTESELKNFYSLVGINFGNVKNNNKVIMDKISALSAEGWELMSTAVATQSPSTGFEQGMCMTRYILRKAK
ncbi:MAG: hypothetical protein EPN85_13865 [Bacteroidetes bacterium]|nr:MAG: hypothetical protein EPN85_13865 [Bacteroidota bacterium]